MATRLSNEDRRAIDLLLDQATTANHSFTSSTETVDTNRVHAIEKILHLLDGYEAAEPPTDLVARTMKRIESADAQAPVLPQTTIMGAPIGQNPPA